MPSVACGAVADRAVTIWSAHAMALLTAAGHGGGSFRLHKRMWRPARSSGLKGLGEIHLFGRQSLFAVDGRPRRRCMPAVQELLVDPFVATPAISGRQFGGDHEAMMVFPFLPCCGLVAVKAVHALPGMSAHLVFMNDRVLRACMTFRALTGGANQVRTRLVCFNFRPGTIDEEGSQNQGKSNDNSHKHGSKRHMRHLLREIAVYRRRSG